MEIIIVRKAYMKYACREIPVDLCMASPFSRQMANGNAGPASAELYGSKTNFSL